MSDKPEYFIDENGLRLDGRRADEIRPMTMEMGVLSRADGSCYLEWGNNKVIAAVYGPRELHPRRLQRPSEVLVRYRYNMAAFSVEDRIRPGPSRRSTEISKVSGEAFEPVVMTQYYPGAVIDVFAEVLQADAGTRTAAINAATIALADAGIPMKGLVAACAVGKVDGQLVLDLNKPEDNHGDADLPVAMTQDGDITLLQMDGNLTHEEFITAMEMVKKGCDQIFELQRKTLVSRFGSEGDVDALEGSGETETKEEAEEGSEGKGSSEKDDVSDTGDDAEEVDDASEKFKEDIADFDEQQESGSDEESEASDEDVKGEEDEQ
ncbi:MAG: exosome complex exonuclease Rrp41 [Euryarchaeota archaeon]|nr:exosome complex exonuclease Rrp41 [Euryarchaeota archaeon]